MDKRERKIIHELANAFNLKSKSSGAGKNRYPVLYKTKRSLSFDDDIFDRVEERLTRRLIPRLDRHNKAILGSRPRTPASKAGVNYSEGEIVGATAPELGSDNRGRAMLEKMGWSKGTALGSTDNKGRLIPVEHIMKTNRAGLG